MQEWSGQKACEGLVVGTAVGDAIGLPMEGLRPETIQRRFGGGLRHRLVFGRGMVSDDTDHMLFAAQAYLASPQDVDGFARALSWKLRAWLLGLPAGIGLATLRAIVRMWLGFRVPGVRSAGNGPAMRSPVLGAALADEPERLEAYVLASTRLTHTDPRARSGALALARLAAWAIAAPRPTPPEPAALAAILGAVAGPDDAEWTRLADQLASHRERGSTVAAFVADLGLARGVTGYMYHSVPVAIYAWLRHYGDYAATLEAVVAAGGDTDSVGAFAGALAGAVVGMEGIPAAWRERILDWPRGERVWLEVAARIAGARERRPVPHAWALAPARNLLLLGAVLVHGFRRLVPF